MVDAENRTLQVHLSGAVDLLFARHLPRHRGPALHVQGHGANAQAHAQVQEHLPAQDVTRQVELFLVVLVVVKVQQQVLHGHVDDAGGVSG